MSKWKGLFQKCLNDSFNLNLVGNLKSGPVTLICTLFFYVTWNIIALALQLKTVDASNLVSELYQEVEHVST